VGLKSPVPAATATRLPARVPLRKVLRVVGFTLFLLGY
jgi:hypothetical protein